MERKIERKIMLKYPRSRGVNGLGAAQAKGERVINGKVNFDRLNEFIGKTEVKIAVSQEYKSKVQNSLQQDEELWEAEQGISTTTHLRVDVVFAVIY